MDSSLTAAKLASPKGEDCCKVFGKVISDGSVFENGIVSVDYLLFPQFDTAVMVSANDRLNRILAAKEEAVKGERYERAAQLRKEEQIIRCTLIREKHLHIQ